jgi:hypothetical protein
LSVRGKNKEIQMKKNSGSCLLDKDYNENFKNAAYEPGFIEVKLIAAHNKENW